MPEQPAKGVAFALFCLGFLGLMPIIANARPDGFSALRFTFFGSLWQALFALPLFLVELRATGEPLGPALRRLFGRGRTTLVLLGTSVLFALAAYLYILSVRAAGTISAAIAIQTYPLFAILLETVFLKRGKTRAELGLTLVLFMTLYYLGTDGTWSIASLSPWFLLALAVPLLWAVAHIIVKEQINHTGVTPVQVTFIRLAVSAVIMLAALLIFEPEALLADGLRFDLQWFAAFLGLVYYLELVAWFYAVRAISVSLASSITAPWPALTMVLAVFFLGESVTGEQMVAFAIIAATIYGLIALGMRNARATG